MVKRPRRHWSMMVGMCLAGWLVSGCGSSTQPAQGQRFASWPTVTMIAFSDQWPSALPRYYDIADLLFKKTLAPGTIQFRYNPSTSGNALVGEIKGWGLKPNFAYQLKLAGKPGAASGGLWGSEADMTTNSAILVNARWWDYKAETAQFNTTDPYTVMASANYQAGWVAGYVYFGYVLTDENGNIKCYGGKTGPVAADANGWVPITANRCYHITGKTGQETKIGLAADTTPITYDLKRTSYGYTTTTGTSLQLWYEKETDNALDFALPAGQHDVVLMVTEESFHNNLGGLTNTTDGGYWDTVWVSDWPTINSPKTGRAWTPVRGGRILFASGAANAAPAATIVSPADGGTARVGTVATVKVKATASLDLTVAVSIDGAAAQPATYNEGTGCYELAWNTAGLAGGSQHTLVATATDTAGAMAVATSAVTMVANQSPTASFTSSLSGRTATLTSTSTDSDGSIVSSAWTFGDGGTGSGATVSHTYASNGTYAVTLTVTDNEGAVASKSQNVVVNVANNVMTAGVTVTWLGSPGKYQPYAMVTVMANGAPCSGVAVTGSFSGTFVSKASAVTTDANGIAQFYGPPRTKSTGPLTFTVTKLAKSGYTAGPLPVSGSY